MRSRLPWHSLSSRDHGAAVQAFAASLAPAEVLDRKTRELLMVSLGCLLHRPRCVEEHIDGAMAAGATKAEICEALLMATTESF